MQKHDPETLDFSRRRFLRHGSNAALGVWLSSHWAGCLVAAEEAAADLEQQHGYSFLNPHQAASLDAISAQIIPTTDTPGAREAGVVNFFDRALSSHAGFAVDPLNGWIAELDGEADKHQAGTSFYQLNDQQQKDILTAQENTGGFGLIRFLTLVGMFAMSSYGGNRNNIGWQLLGFDHRHAWQPPFGYYDAEWSQQQGNEA